VLLASSRQKCGAGRFGTFGRVSLRPEGAERGPAGAGMVAG